MDVCDFDYALPKQLIAQHPANPRDGARFLVMKGSGGGIEHRRFRDIIDYLKKGDVLVLNSTKVVNAKLIGKKSSGADAQIILTRCVRKKGNVYECRVKTRNPIMGTKIILEGGYAEIIAQESVDRFVVRLSSNALLKIAMLPSPPYIRHDVSEDEYQTVYAKMHGDRGSLAAPTAGLHFTKGLLKRIRDKGVNIVYIRLHVGFGTFLPITGIEGHRTEKEYFEISANAAQAINNRDGRLVAVGTTTLKALESSSVNGKIIPTKNFSEVFIYPGHKFSSGVEALVTNFHLPKSSLLLLTCAFCGKQRIMHAYEEAIEKGYRFYSLGDAMLIERSCREN